MMKRWMLLPLVAATAVAHASFELGLIADNAGEVDRYDMQTGTYLGSFGKGLIGGAGSIDIDQNAGIAYVGDTVYNKVHKFNYSTGEYLGALPGNPFVYFFTLLNNGNYLASTFGNTNTSYVTNNGTTFNTINTSSLYLEGHAQTADGRVWYLDGPPNANLKLYSTTNPANAPTLTFTGANLAQVVTGLSAYGNQLAFAQYSGSTVRTLFAFTTNASGVSGTLATNVSLPSSTYAINDSAFGHGGVAYFITSNGTASSLVKFNTNTGYTSLMPLAYTEYARGIAVVVAPEPSSYLAMGLGLAAFARLRRRRR